MGLEKVPALIRRAAERSPRRTILVALTLTVIGGSSCAGGSPTAAPPATRGAVASSTAPAGGLSGSPTAPAPWFVLGGGGGILGPSTVGAGVASFSITNNGVSTHRFQLIGLPSGETAAQVSALVRQAGHHWPPASVRVLYRGPTQASQVTVTPEVAPLQSGYYALVDLAPDPQSGKPYAYRTPYVWVFQVVNTVP